MPHSTEDAQMITNEPPALAPDNATELDEQRSTRLKIKNRRKRYLDLHPEYFHSADLELAGPLLYDRLVRRFQSAEEREKEGRERGYTGVLEADLVRSEAKIEALQHPDPNSPIVYKRSTDGSIVGVEPEEGDRAKSKEEGWALWTDIMGQRFLRGDDRDFEYENVDESEEYDDREEEDRSRLEDYLTQETPRYVGEGTPQGETGIQDF